MMCKGLRLVVNLDISLRFAHIDFFRLSLFFLEKTDRNKMIFKGKNEVRTLGILSR